MKRTQGVYLLIKMSQIPEFSAAIVDGVTLKPFIKSLSIMDFKTLFFIIDAEGFRLDQPNMSDDHALFVSWEAKREDFIFFDYNSDEPELRITVMANDLEKALQTLQKKKSVMFFKFENQDQLKVSIAERIEKPNRDHFPNSTSIRILKHLELPKIELPIYQLSENYPVVAAESTHACEQFQKIVITHDKSKNLNKLFLKIMVYKNAIVAVDPLTEGDGFRIGNPNKDEVPNTIMKIPLRYFRDFKKLAGSTPMPSLLKFYSEYDTLKIKCGTGNYGVLRLYFKSY